MRQNPSKEENERIKFCDPLFHDSRFSIVEQQLSPEHQQLFKKLLNEDKAFFINLLIKEGKLSW
ncbi:MAG: hypothetical protein ACFFDF_17510 [Candidatus Odinarchaeota archaeon]